MAKTALETALDLLSRRSLTTREVITRLEKKGFLEQEIQEGIDRLREWGYLNDHSYAENFCQTYLNREPRQKIYYDLVRKGVEPSMASEVIETVHSSEQEQNLCLDLAKKIWDSENERWHKKYCYQKSYEGMPPNVVIRKKVGNKLWRKGFASEIINRCLDELDKSG